MQLTKDFNNARSDRRVLMNCLQRESEFLTYTHRPTPAAAEELCEECPILKLCGDFAKSVQKPTLGIWGGRVWVPSEVDSTRGVMLPRPSSRAA